MDLEATRRHRLAERRRPVSNFILSQTTRELMRFGPGILPSLISASNKEGETPT
jgi:hypothetical protein